MLQATRKQLALPYFRALRALEAGGIGVLPTDTLYGLVGRAADAAAVERIFVTKGRDATKPLIILISDIAQLALFSVILDDAARAAMERYWPGPVSLIVPSTGSVTQYLHRGTGALAFRLPDDSGLRGLITAVGPLVAPSANPQGAPPATTTEEAHAYFGDHVDFYVDGGRKAGKPSTLLRLTDEGIETLRP